MADSATGTKRSVVLPPKNARSGAIEIKKETREGFKVEVEALIRSGATAIVVDCRQLGYVDSSGFGVLVALGLKARTCGVPFVMAAPSDELATLLETLSLAPAVVIWTLDRWEREGCPK